MDPLHIAIAFVPLAVYLLLLGLINLSPRPFLTTGLRDGMALAIGLSGLMLVGPLALFLPENAISTFGAYVWLLLLALYFLSVILFLLMSRPRLVIYNASAAEIHQVLEHVTRQMDPTAGWSDGTFVLPQLFVQLHIETFPALRSVSLVAVGSRQSWLGWKRLEGELSQALREMPGVVNPYGVTLILFATLIAGLTTYWLATDREGVTAALWEMMRF